MAFDLIQPKTFSTKIFISFLPTILILKICVASHNETLGQLMFECPQGWFAQFGNCYLIWPEQVTWKEADDFCVRNGAELINPADEVEQEFISQTLTSLSRKKWSWTGVQTKENARPLFPGIWDIDQPDKSNGQCAAIGHNAQLSFRPCRSLAAVACQALACLEGYFRCANGKCLHPDWLCDDQNDCGDKSDEQNCDEKCRHFLYQDVGQFKATSAEYIRNDADCLWTIQARLGMNIKLMFKSIHLEDNADYLEVFSGGPTLKQSTLIQRFTGHHKDVVLYSENNFIIIRLYSDHSITSSGFEVEWTTDIKGLGSRTIHLQADKTLKTLLSPLYPILLPNMVHCWYIEAFSQTIISMQVMSLELENGKAGHLEISYGSLTNVVANLTHLETPMNLISNSRRVYICLHTTKFASRGGFKILYKEGCDIEMTSPFSNIISPGYNFLEPSQSRYPNDVNCFWKVKANKANNSPIHIIFVDFALEETDFVQVNNGTNVGTYTGHHMPPMSTSKSDLLQVEFHSNIILSNRGFKAVIIEDCIKFEENGLVVKTLSTFNRFGNNEKFSQQVEVSCEEGYQFKESYMNLKVVPMTCLMDGQWNISWSPHCLPISCGSPPSLPNGFVLVSTGVTYKSRVTYHCKNGFNLIGSSVTCQSDGLWSQLPICTKIMCSKLIASSMVDMLESDGNNYGSVVTFSCQKGFHLIGAQTIICNASSVWSSLPPRCEPRKCSPPKVANAQVLSSNVVYYSHSINISCNPGYFIRGTQFRYHQQVMCMENGQFEKLPHCDDENECLKMPCNFNQLCVNLVGNFRCDCKVGFQKQGNDCVDINECMVDNAGCHHACINTQGSYYCACTEGYWLYEQNSTDLLKMLPLMGPSLQNSIHLPKHDCIKVMCPAPAVHANSVLMTAAKSFYYGSVVEYKCEIGYSILGRNRLNCLSNGQWDHEAPTCKLEYCQNLQTTVKGRANLHSIVPFTETVPFGSKVILYCNYTNSRELIKKTLFCGYDRKLMVYRLQGDSPECPAIDCGVPALKPSVVMPSNLTTTENTKFLFVCNMGFVRKGFSPYNDTIVRCDHSGIWQFGNLVCEERKCHDPGSPAGGTQLSSSYRLGDSVKFTCSKPGFVPVPYEEITCIKNGEELTWNNEIPSCQDKAKPIFKNCPTEKIEVEIYQSARIPDLQAVDNSGLIHPIYSENFINDQIVTRDFNATFIAEDFSGNNETCIIEIKTKEILPVEISCPYFIEKPVSSFGESIELSPLVTSKHSVKTVLSPERIIPTLQDINRRVHVLAEALGQNGDLVNCSFYVFLRPTVCFSSTFRSPQNGILTCTEMNSDGQVTCSIECNQGYFLPDGLTRSSVICSGQNQWSGKPIDCVRGSERSNYLRFTILYNTREMTSCYERIKQDFVAKFLDIRTQISGYCYGPDNRHIKVDNLNVTQGKLFQVWSQLTLSLATEPLGKPLEECLADIYDQLETPSFRQLFNFTSDQCHILSMKLNVDTSPSMCPVGKYLAVPFIGDPVCLPCTTGTRFNGNQCELCPVGTYQDVPGQSECKRCPNKMTTYGNRSIAIEDCIALCGPGYLSKAVNNAISFICEPCPVNTYWSPNESCLPCPSGTSTMNKMAQIQCTGECEPGTYSTTGFGPCKKCPIGFFQPHSGESTCFECGPEQTTFNEGSSNHTQCINGYGHYCSNIVKCKNRGRCEMNNHKAYCKCIKGFAGPRCEQKMNPCESKPCFNDGICRPDPIFFSYNCECPTIMTTSFERHPGQQGGLDFISSHSFNSEEECKEQCQKEETCKMVTFVNNMCIIYDHSESLTPSNIGAVTLKKTTHKDLLFTGRNCERKVNLECKENICGIHGVCQELPQGYLCHCPNGIFLGMKCYEPDNCLSNKCKNSATCYSNFATVGSQCRCQQNGFKGQYCDEDINECELNPDACLNGGTCIDAPGDYKCECLPGFSGKNCELSSDICADNDCPEGRCYFDQQILNKTCICKKNELKDANGNCLKEDPCKMFSCLNGGVCLKLETGVAFCKCPAGYEGKQCQRNKDDCKSDPCGDGNKCIDGINSFTCKCKPGFTGKYCEIDINECEEGNYNTTSRKCNEMNTVNCTDKIDGFVCHCKDGFIGEFCEEDDNECKSHPCLHGGTCLNKENGFTCQCPKGWIGKSCEKAVDFCAVNPCKNKGRCQSLQNNFFCRCPLGTYGLTCVHVPDLCSVLVKMCVNKGTCSVTKDQAFCSCQNEFYGRSCQLSRNICFQQSGICKNGGKCLNKGIDYECLCKDGFVGRNCSEKLDVCKEFRCPKNSECVLSSDDLKTPTCKCNDGKTYANGLCKDISPDFDLFFDGDISSNGALLRHTLPLQASSLGLTLSFYTLLFHPNQTNAVIFSLFYVDRDNQLMKMMEIHESHIVVWNELKSVSENFPSLKAGKSAMWHHVTVSWGLNGNLKLFVDGISEINRTVSVKPKTGVNVLIKLGIHFSGYISQLYIWDRIIPYDTLILGKEKTLFNPPSGYIQSWGDYLLDRGIERRHPSHSMKPICENGVYAPICILQPDKTRPKFENCQSKDVFFTSGNWITEGLPLEIPRGNGRITHSLHNDGVYSWGAYPQIFVLKDDQGNYDTCRSKLYVLDENKCQYRSHAEIEICKHHGGICAVKCGPYSAPCQKLPKVITCGKLGKFNYREPFEPFLVPSCGLTSPATSDISIKFLYHFSTVCQENFSARIGNYVLQQIQATGKEWPGLCNGQLNDICSNVNVSIVCQFGRPLADGEVFIKGARSELKSPYNKQTLAAKDVVKKLFYSPTEMDFLSVGNAKLQEPISINSEKSCSPGSGLVDDLCIVCGLGMYSNAVTKTCEFCSYGQYQENTGQSSCHQCPFNTTTLYKGSADKNDCVLLCPAGHFYNISTASCNECPKGFYQNKLGKPYCLPCKLGTTTLTTGSVTQNQCQDVCRSGFEEIDGRCDSCQKGFYRQWNIHDVCVPCPVGSTTLMLGSTKVTDCTIAECKAGEHLNEETLFCTKCDYGTYQPKVWQMQCTKCPPTTWTRIKGSTQKTDCEPYCPAGQYFNKTLGCLPCPVGSWNNANQSMRFQECVSCPDNFTTSSKESASVADCTRLNCAAGSYMNIDQFACVPCPHNTYQPAKGQTECIKCVNGESEPGSTSHLDCKLSCPAGKEHSRNGSCVSCLAGWYKSEPSIQPCEKCRGNYTSNTDRTSCSVLSCLPGFELGLTMECQKCPQGYYKDVSGNIACTKCPLMNATTNGYGATSLKDCNLILCSPGYYLNIYLETCHLCTQGTYNPFYNRNISCLSCPKDRTTLTLGSLALDDCSQVSCKSGSYLLGSSCQLCPVGYYQPQSMQRECLPCPFPMTTFEEGADTQSQCLSACGDGEEMNYYTYQCTKCPYGFYRDSKSSLLCVQCPFGYTTNDVGSVSETECVITLKILPIPNSPSVFLVVDMQYEVKYCNSEKSRLLYEQIITDHIRQRLFALSEVWKGLCQDDCRDIFVSLECPQPDVNFTTSSDNRFRRTTKYANVRVKISGTKFTLQKANQNISHMAATIVGRDCSRISRYSVESQDVVPVSGCTARVECVCPLGYLSEGGNITCGYNCIPCPAGKFHNLDTNTCDVCPIAYYQDEKGKTACKRCTGTSKTSIEGANSAELCTENTKMAIIGTAIGVFLAILLLILLLTVLFIYYRKHKKAVFQKAFRTTSNEPYVDPLYKNKYNSSRSLQSNRLWMRSKGDPSNNRIPSHYVAPSVKDQYDDDDNDSF